MSNVCIYKNTTIRTIHFTIYRNTIWTIFKLNILIYFNTITIITFNITINWYSASITIYSTLLIKSYWTSLNSSTTLINTIWRICIIFTPNMTNICVYINTTISAIHFTIYKNTILTILKLNILTYFNTITIII